MNQDNRFIDANKRLSDFYNEVWVVCPACAGKAIATANHADARPAKLVCPSCGYHKQLPVQQHYRVYMPAHLFFDAPLFLQAPFKSDRFWAYNHQHLLYLEQYIAATLREHKDRTHFTLLEKLPKFYHEAKNREALLKIIAKLKGL